jgi:hypothetical protein
MQVDEEEWNASGIVDRLSQASLIVRGWHGWLEEGEEWMGDSD